MVTARNTLRQYAVSIGDTELAKYATTGRLDYIKKRIRSLIIAGEIKDIN